LRSTAAASSWNPGASCRGNPVDYKVRLNADPGGTPRVLGWDAAGTVVAVGAEVELFEVGDEV
jgi:NADPH:quinone reductase-like Zn-dependent oxidoreductase